MATLVLSTVGGIVGGPVGAMIGALAGQAIDRELLFKPKGRDGPRLTELAVQTSSYGTPIPRQFGTMRVAGTVIWATDLIEHRQREGGKGRPTVTSYSYTASFAVALSARPILSVGRIWADGKLLRGAAGDWKVRTGFRLHLGGEDQAVDPLIASAEGEGLAPAHRGIAYAVFENLELEEFGNRIPSLSFEVTADPGPVAAGEIVAELSRGTIAAGEAMQLIAGYSGYGETVRGACAPLIESSGAWPVARGAGFVLVNGAHSGALPLVGPGVGGAGVERAIESPDRVPRRVVISHYDPARDYQAGVQSASDPAGQDRERRIELPAALPAEAAKRIAEAELIRADCMRIRRMVRPGWSALGIAPGQRVAIVGEAGQWRVIEARIEDGDVALMLTPVAPNAIPVGASPGRVAPAPDRVHGATVLHAFECPHLGEELLSGPRLSIAACGTAPGWRRAALALSGDAGARWEPIGATAAPAVIGVVAVPAGRASALIEDRVSQLVVDLAHAELALADASVEALDAGANIAMVGDELIQFGRAEPMGGGRWRLTELWRGRRGTEDAIGAGVAGDRFVLIERDALVVRDGIAAGGVQRVMATGVGDLESVEQALMVTGRSATPPAPVAPHVARTAGGRVLRWTRRSRAGWRWSDGTDAPVGESIERYHLRLSIPGQPPVVVMRDTPFWTVDGTSAMQVEIRQAGDHGLSPPATLTLEAME